MSGQTDRLAGPVLARLESQKMCRKVFLDWKSIEDIYLRFFAGDVPEGLAAVLAVVQGGDCGAIEGLFMFTVVPIIPRKPLARSRISLESSPSSALGFDSQGLPAATE